MRSRTLGLSLLGFALAAVVLPIIADAVTTSQGINGTIGVLNTIFNNLIGLFITLAIVLFFWGLIKYLWSMEQENAHEGLKIMFWGLIAIFVMVSIWGLIQLIQSTLGVQNASSINAPKGVTLPYQ